MVNFNNIEQFHLFSVDLQTDGNNFRLFLANEEGELIIEIGGIHTYLCDKAEFNDYIEFKNQQCYINDVECTIVGIDYETHQQFNDWCERLEMEEFN